MREKLLFGEGRTLPSAAIEAAFREHCRLLCASRARLLALFMLTGALLGQSVQVLAFDEAVAPGPCGIAALSACYLALTRRRPGAEYLPWLYAAMIGIGCLIAAALAGHSAGRLAWAALVLAPLTLAALPLPLERRAALTLFFALLIGAGAGLSQLRRSALADTELANFLLTVTAATAISVGLGQLLYLQARQIHRQTHELTQLERSFQTRVDARTLELRRLLRHIESTREAERTRIARELHDELGQELSALRYELSFIRRRYEKDPGGIATNLEELEALVRRTAATTRGLVSELRPKVLDDLGLPAAVQWLVERTRSRGNLEIRCQVASELSSLDARVASVAFRLLQEALTNVVRHAQARSAEVTAQSRDGSLELRVSDDGIGLKAAQARENRSGGHVGLLGMRERALALGGHLEVRERESGGTEVRAVLPLAPPPEDEAQP